MITKKRKLWSQLIAVIVLVAVLWTACASKAVTAADKIELGQKYLTELNYTEAIASFTEAIKLDPNNIQAYMGRAEAYMALGEYDKALEDYQFVCEKTEEMPYTRALSYIGQAEVYEKTDEPEKAISDYELSKALLNANDAGKAEDVSEEDVGVKLVQVLYAHAALCETLKNYNTALEDYNDLLELGEKVDSKRDEILSQLGESIEEENGLLGTEADKVAPEPDTEEPADGSAAEKPTDEPKEEPAPEQESSSASESQPASEKTKPEEAASSSEQPADKEEAASSQEEASTQQEEKTNWVTYTETKTYLDSNFTLHVKYGIGEKQITIQQIEDCIDGRAEDNIIYYLSAPLRSAQRVEKGYDGHIIFYVPEGTIVTESSITEFYPVQKENFSFQDSSFNWIETNRVLSDSELDYGLAGQDWGERLTVRKGTMYQTTNGDEASLFSMIGGVVFCAE